MSFVRNIRSVGIVSSYRVSPCIRNIVYGLRVYRLVGERKLCARRYRPAVRSDLGHKQKLCRHSAGIVIGIMRVAQYLLPYQNAIFVICVGLFQYPVVKNPLFPHNPTVSFRVKVIHLSFMVVYNGFPQYIVLGYVDRNLSRGRALPYIFSLNGFLHRPKNRRHHHCRYPHSRSSAHNGRQSRRFLNRYCRGNLRSFHKFLRRFRGYH